MRLQMAWDGYKIYNYYDKFEIQEELTDYKLTFSKRDRTTMLEDIKRIVCRDSEDPIEIVSSLLNRLDKQGKKGTISPAAYMTCEFKSNKFIQEQLFEKIFIDNDYV